MMNKLIALCLTLCLSLSAIAQSDGQALPSRGDEALIVLNAQELEQSLKQLAEALRQEQRVAKQTSSHGSSSTLRLQLLLHLLQQAKQAPVLTPKQGVSQPIVLPAPVQRVEDNDERLKRIEDMLLLLAAKQGVNSTSKAQPIINKRSKPSKDKERIAELEAQLATLLAGQTGRDTLLRVDTVYRTDTVRITEAASVPALQIQPTATIVQRDTLYKERTKVEVADFKRSIYFGVGKSVLDARSLRTMQEVLSFLQKYPTAKVAILGFASPEGNAERNRALAEKRMQSAVEYLQAAGIHSQVETFVGGVDDKARNPQLARRVDIVLVGTN